MHSIRIPMHSKCATFLSPSFGLRFWSTASWDFFLPRKISSSFLRSLCVCVLDYTTMPWSWPFSKSACSSSSSPPFGSSSTAEEVTHAIDASDRTAIVTGASNGIGVETARVLALRGAEVVLAVRNVAAGQQVKDTILKHNSNARLHVLQLDLSSMDSVRNFCHNFKAMNLPLNILVNNAGIMGIPFKLSLDGIEMQFATNHIGHFLLTNLLLHKMKSTANETGIQGRIVNVSSAAHYKYTYPGGIRFHNLNDESGYSPLKAYGQSKLANILHAKELARRFEEEGVNLRVNALHPGVIKTNIASHFPSYVGLLVSVASICWKSIPQGAATQCFLALHPSINSTNGKYFVDCQESNASEMACDPKLAKDLWEYSETLTCTKASD